MRRIVYLLLFLCTWLLGTEVEAKKKYPVIKFEENTVDFGTFSLNNPVQTAVFKFRNVGEAKLVINTVHTACGCTVADYPKDFIRPGGVGKITVTYDATNKMPGRFKRMIQVFTNCKNDCVRIAIQGNLTDLARENVRK